MAKINAEKALPEVAYYLQKECPRFYTSRVLAKSMDLPRNYGITPEGLAHSLAQKIHSEQVLKISQLRLWNQGETSVAGVYYGVLLNEKPALFNARVMKDTPSDYKSFDYKVFEIHDVRQSRSIKPLDFSNIKLRILNKEFK